MNPELKLDELYRGKCEECSGEGGSGLAGGGTCQKCDGYGIILTPAGRVMADFIKKLSQSPKFYRVFGR